MKHFNKLPGELALAVFSYIDSKADLLQCKLTCNTPQDYKNWQTFVDESFYKNIELNIFSIEKADGFIKALTKNDTLCYFVKGITLKTNQTTDEHKLLKFLKVLKFVVENCPNLTDVNTDLGNHEDFWEILSSKKRRLENIIFNGEKYKYEKDLYKNTVYGYKDTLKTLTYEITVEGYEKSQDELWMKRIQKSSIEYLGNFKSLENLTFKTVWFSNFYALDNIIPENLSSLELHIDLLDRTATPRKNADFLSKNNITKIKPCYKLKQLSLRLALSDEASIKYLMHKFPNLKNLNITRFYKAFSISKNTMVDFTKYLIGVRQFNTIPSIIVSEDPTDDLFTNLIEINKKIDSNIMVNYSVSILSANISKAGKVTKTMASSKTVSYATTIIKTDLDGMAYLKIVGNDLTQLYIHGNDNLECSAIFSLCSNLKVLKLNFSTVSLDKTHTIMGGNDSIETLEMYSCLVNPKTLSILPHYLPNLKTLKIVDSISTATSDVNDPDTIKIDEPNGFDIPNIISSFPKLECLELESSRFIPSEPDNHINKNTGFKTLILNRCLPCGYDPVDFSKLKALLSKFISSSSKAAPNLQTLNLLQDNSHVKHRPTSLNLEDILTSFLQLKCLEIENAQLHSCKPHKNNPAIETLILRNCVNNFELYSDLSCCLPNLKSMQVVSRRIPSSKFLPVTGEYVPFNEQIMIDMPNTSLQRFSYTFMNENSTPHACLLKLSKADDNNTRGEERYYCSEASSSRNDVLSMKECEKDKYYYNCEQRPSALRVEVNCKEFPRALRYIRVRKWTDNYFIIEGGSVFDPESGALKSIGGVSERFTGTIQACS